MKIPCIFVIKTVESLMTKNSLWVWGFVPITLWNEYVQSTFGVSNMYNSVGYHNTEFGQEYVHKSLLFSKSHLEWKIWFYLDLQIHLKRFLKYLDFLSQMFFFSTITILMLLLLLLLFIIIKSLICSYHELWFFLNSILISHFKVENILCVNLC